MNRRTLLAATGGFLLPGMKARAADVTSTSRPEEGPAYAPGWRCFSLTTQVALLDDPGPAQLWLPVAQTAGGYQVVLDTQWSSTGQADLVHDPLYGAGLLRATWPEGVASRTAELRQIITTRDRVGGDQTLPATAVEQRFWSEPTASLPTGGIVHETAARITAGLTEPRARLRSIYDWVVENTTRDPATPGCGTGDIQTMLQSGRLGGKCADINSLITGLARAAGFPARDVYGIRVGESRQPLSLGAGSVVSKAQHCRSEVWLEGTGWFPIDPADVRKAMLDGKLSLDDPAIRALRERLFGGWEMNWVGYNSATDMVLPGAWPGRRPECAFMMYPCAFTRNGQPDCLDPAKFQYESSAREIMT